MLEGKRIVLGVTGGIAAYKAAEVVSLLVKRGAQVRVAMTEHAQKFVTPLTMETLSGNGVSADLFAPRQSIAHIALARWADAFVVAPCTANAIGKFANGIADDLLSTTYMAMRCPVVLAPAMNAAMWRSRANQENVRRLAGWGTRFVGPESGRLACGEEDVGRMSAPEAILEAVERLFVRADFAGRRVLVTAGPTREMLDPVRFLSNRSTGKMGYAIARAARERGAQVVLVSGPVALQPPEGVEFVGVQSAAELYAHVTSRAPACDVVVQAAAPADFRPRVVSAGKIKKTGQGMTLELENTADIAAALGAAKREGQILVAFAAETENLLENARRKLEAKNADLIVANDVTQPGAGFAADTNAVTLITRADAREVPLCDKFEIAQAILTRVTQLW